jgi:hypothetical protein
MDVRSKLAIPWMALGVSEIIAAYLFIHRKQDRFADPNAWFAAMGIKSVKKALIPVLPTIEPDNQAAHSQDRQAAG